MIGEREIASGFHSFWTETLPLLTPSCVTIFNRTRGEYLEGYSPVDRELKIDAGAIRWPDLYAEVAFELFKLSHERQVVFHEVIRETTLFEQTWRSAERRIMAHRRVQPAILPIEGDLEYHYLLALGRRYDAFRSRWPFEVAEFSPRLRGCGILGICEADLSLSETLVEVKTVDRNFNSRDIKQMIIYLALDHLSGAKRWSEALLLNPRRAFYAKFLPEEFVEYISAGKRAALVYQDIEAFLMHRDFLLEHRF